MKVYISRSSVAMGDDINAPNADTVTVPDDTPLEQIIKGIAQSGYLPRIAGGHATWSVTSNVPLAVVAQEWSEPRMLPFATMRKDLAELDHKQGALRLNFNYHAQIDPKTVYEMLWGFRLNAI